MDCPQQHSRNLTGHPGHGNWGTGQKSVCQATVFNAGKRTGSGQKRGRLQGQSVRAELQRSQHFYFKV